MLNANKVPSRVRMLELQTVVLEAELADVSLNNGFVIIHGPRASQQCRVEVVGDTFVFADPQRRFSGTASVVDVPKQLFQVRRWLHRCASHP